MMSFQYTISHPIVVGLVVNTEFIQCMVRIICFHTKQKKKKKSLKDFTVKDRIVSTCLHAPSSGLATRKTTILYCTLKTSH